MLLTTPWVQALAVYIILRFDGSVRRQQPHLASRAACSAALFGHDVDGQLIALGGTRLDGQITSAEAEYNGLLLGLEELVHRYESGGLGTWENCIIQGDCKTVIEQVQGRAKPRRLQFHFDQAQELIKRLPFQVELQHIPREINTVCDWIGKAIVTRADHEAFQEAWKILFDAKFEDRSDLDSSSGDELSFITSFWAEHAANVPQWRRLPFYRRMAAVALAERDFSTLASVSLDFTMDVETFWKKIPHMEDRQGESILVEAVVLGLLGLESSGQRKKAEKLRRKHRILFDRNGPLAASIWACLDQPDITVPVIEDALTELLGDQSLFAPAGFSLQDGRDSLEESLPAWADSFLLEHYLSQDLFRIEAQTDIALR